jgi:hypothetical protein
MGTLKDLARYFLHGILFSLIFSFFIIGVTVSLGLLALLNAIFVALLNVIFVIGGLIIGFLLLIFLIGEINAFLDTWIWSSVHETEFWTVLFHGFVLFIALLIAEIPQITIDIVFPGLVPSLAWILVYGFINGVIAREVIKTFD